MPVAAVTTGGNCNNNMGSNTATGGMNPKSIMMILLSSFGTEITAATVHSEPVPAVVGTATIGGNLRNPKVVTVNAPWYALIDLALQILAPTTFARSIAEPPPTATNPSQLPCRNNASASSTSSTWGFGNTPSYVSKLKPQLDSALFTGATMPLSMSTRSVTTSGFLLPSSCKSRPSSLVLFGPVNRRGLATGTILLAMKVSSRFNNAMRRAFLCRCLPQIAKASAPTSTSLRMDLAMPYVTFYLCGRHRMQS
mmetsp:Transcript_68642/g.128043  ORF Transcript_68642/g.128043 Transcript_68642/m.128043 type:complete len:253 (+) Transcript_68642:737-1495(+)